MFCTLFLDPRGRAGTRRGGKRDIPAISSQGLQVKNSYKQTLERNHSLFFTQGHRLCTQPVLPSDLPISHLRKCKAHG